MKDKDRKSEGKSMCLRVFACLYLCASGRAHVTLITVYFSRQQSVIKGNLIAISSKLRKEILSLLH